MLTDRLVYRQLLLSPSVLANPCIYIYFTNLQIGRGWPKIGVLSFEEGNWDISYGNLLKKNFDCIFDEFVATFRGSEGQIMILCAK